MRSAQDQSATDRFRLGRRPALDGMRGIAILAVMGIHADESILRGGYLGVQVFFVLSGFLITALLIEESERHDSISLPRFYARRALRLLPAIVVVVAVCSLYAIAFPHRGSTEDYFRDGFAALFYWANWLFAFVGLKNHVLVHTWSLSIEEQFYLFWPFLLMLLLRWRVGFAGLLAVTLGGAAASALWRMALHTDVFSVDRSYFGTDTRVDALLIGCALAVIACWDRLPKSRLATLALHAAGLAGGLAVAYASVRVARKSAVLYEGGFTVIALATAALIAMVLVAPDGWVARVLSVAPLRWLGRVSYGLYLWHLPIFVVLYESAPGLSRSVRIAASVVLSLVAAALSYEYIEQPFLRRKERFRVDHHQRVAAPPVAGEPEPA